METIAAVLLMLFGVLCTVKTRGIQIRRFPLSVRVSLSNGATQSGVSAFEAMATSLAATIGTGNIAGVAGAILLGGPGAIFWMWMTALVGMASKYVEIWCGLTLGQGKGPLGYLGRCSWGRFVSPLYGVLCALAALTMGNLIQVQTVAESMESLAAAVCHITAPRWIAPATGLAVAGLIAVTLSGGAKRVGRTAAILVPFMSAAYLVGAVTVIAAHAAALPKAIELIFSTAWRPEAFLVGTARGVFTHEAGLGTAAVARIGRKSDNPHQEALSGIFEVFVDTIVICSVTALCILVSGIPLPYGDGNITSSLVIGAFSTVLGQTVSSAFLAAALLLFAFSSIVSFSLYGGQCVRLLTGPVGERVYRWVFLLLCLGGTLVNTAAAWQISQWVNIFLALINMGGITFLLCRSMERGRTARKRLVFDLRKKEC